MKTRSVRHYRTPRYPAKLQVRSDPGLLRRNVPAAWQAVPELAGAVALFLSANTSFCRGADKGTNAVAVVAPIFDHGEGRGSTGCIVVSPPAFLSEEEAAQIIREELARAGVRAWQTNFSVSGVTVQSPSGTLREPGDHLVYSRTTETPLRTSLADPGKDVAVQFVSKHKLRSFQPHDAFEPTTISTVQYYDTKTAAQSLAAAVRERGQTNLYFGTFYDPCTPAQPVLLRDPKGWPRWLEEAQMRGPARRLLQLQVQDFVKWLQAQGAI